MLPSLPTYQNISDFFLKNFKLLYQTNEKLDCLFIQAQDNFESTFENIYNTEAIFYKWKGIDFPVFIHQNNKNLYQNDGLISFDIALNTFLFLSGILEIYSKEKDQHGRFPFEASLQHKYNFVAIPVVSIYFEILFEQAQKAGISISKKSIPQEIIFTHDIDQLRSGWFENIMFYKENLSLKSIVKIPKNIMVKLFGLKDDYFKGMEKMLAIDKSKNTKAISFFIPKKASKDADFNLNDEKFKALLEQTKASQEIGFHPGYETYKSKENFEHQKAALESFFDQKITKSRQHFLRYDMEYTPYIIAQSGIKEDYTLGFAEQFGFRNGIAHPFYLFNFKENKAFEFLSVPLVFMDVSLTNYTKYSLAERKMKFEEIKDFLIHTKTIFPTQVSVLFHNSVFTDAKYEGFEGFYKKLNQL